MGWKEMVQSEEQMAGIEDPDEPVVGIFLEGDNEVNIEHNSQSWGILTQLQWLRPSGWM